MFCPVCAQRPADVGVLCEECRDELSSSSRITPEQIQLHGRAPTVAALVDRWGRPHRLEPRTLIGRQVELGLAVLEPSISRHHAELVLDGDTWRLRDLGSANGTYLDDHLIEEPTVVRSGDRVRFGQIGFYLLANAEPLPHVPMTRTMTQTIRSQIDPGATPRTRNEPAAAALIAAVAAVADAADEEITNVGLPTVRMRLHEPTGGGGGLIEIEGRHVQLTTTQFELMALMIRRMATESHQPDLVRGFVRSSELIADLSWDTREPSENHVKQLVRRVRRALIKSEIGDLIESRHRFGYRLRAVPQLV